jgi:hypothetical protein
VPSSFLQGGEPTNPKRNTPSGRREHPHLLSIALTHWIRSNGFARIHQQCSAICLECDTARKRPLLLGLNAVCVVRRSENPLSACRVRESSYRVNLFGRTNFPTASARGQILTPLATLTSGKDRSRATPCILKELNGGAGEARTPDLRFRNSQAGSDPLCKFLIISVGSTSYAFRVLFGSDPFPSVLSLEP